MFVNILGTALSLGPIYQTLRPKKKIKRFGWTFGIPFFGFFGFVFVAFFFVAFFFPFFLGFVGWEEEEAEGDR